MDKPVEIEFSTLGEAEEHLIQAGIPKVDLRQFYQHSGMDAVNNVARNLMLMKAAGIALPDQIIAIPPTLSAPAFASPSSDILHLNPGSPLWVRPFAEQMVDFKDHLTPSISEQQEREQIAEALAQGANQSTSSLATRLQPFSRGGRGVPNAIVMRGEGIIAPGHGYSPDELETMRQGYLPPGKAMAPRMTPVAGTGTTDDTPMSLQPGSYVIPVKARANLERGGRSAQVHFAEGGEATGVDWARARAMAMIRHVIRRSLEPPEPTVYPQYVQMAHGGFFGGEPGQQPDPREHKGMELASRALVSGQPFELVGGKFKVPSSSGGSYLVNPLPGCETCDCPDFAQGNRCKHIRAVGYQQMFMTQAAKAMQVVSGVDKQQIPMTPEQLDALARAPQQLEALQAEDTFASAWLEMDKEQTPKKMAEGGNVDDGQTPLRLKRRLPSMRGKEVVRILGNMGFEHKRTTGSHFIMSDGTTTVPIPVHNKDLGKGLLYKIIGQSGRTKEEFAEHYATGGSTPQEANAPTLITPPGIIVPQVPSVGNDALQKHLYKLAIEAQQQRLGAGRPDVDRDAPTLVTPGKSAGDDRTLAGKFFDNIVGPAVMFPFATLPDAMLKGFRKVTGLEEGGLCGTGYIDATSIQPPVKFDTGGSADEPQSDSLSQANQDYINQMKSGQVFTSLSEFVSQYNQRKDRKNGSSWSFGIPTYIGRAAIGIPSAIGVSLLGTAVGASGVPSNLVLASLIGAGAGALYPILRHPVEAAQIGMSKLGVSKGASALYPILRKPVAATVSKGVDALYSILRPVAATVEAIEVGASALYPILRKPVDAIGAGVSKSISALYPILRPVAAIGTGIGAAAQISMSKGLSWVKSKLSSKQAPSLVSLEEPISEHDKQFKDLYGQMKLLGTTPNELMMHSQSEKFTQHLNEMADKANFIGIPPETFWTTNWGKVKQEETPTAFSEPDWDQLDQLRILNKDIVYDVEQGKTYQKKKSIIDKQQHAFQKSVALAMQGFASSGDIESTKKLAFKNTKVKEMFEILNNRYLEAFAVAAKIPYADEELSIDEEIPDLPRSEEEGIPYAEEEDEEEEESYTPNRYGNWVPKGHPTLASTTELTSITDTESPLELELPEEEQSELKQEELPVAKPSMRVKKGRFFTEEFKQHVIGMHDSGMPFGEIAAGVGVPKNPIRGILKRAKRLEEGGLCGTDYIHAPTPTRPFIATGGPHGVDDPRHIYDLKVGTVVVRTPVMDQVREQMGMAEGGKVRAMVGAGELVIPPGTGDADAALRLNAGDLSAATEVFDNGGEAEEFKNGGPIYDAIKSIGISSESKGFQGIRKKSPGQGGSSFDEIFDTLADTGVINPPKEIAEEADQRAFLKAILEKEAEAEIIAADKARELQESQKNALPTSWDKSISANPEAIAKMEARRDLLAKLQLAKERLAQKQAASPATIATPLVMPAAAFSTPPESPAVQVGEKVAAPAPVMGTSGSKPAGAAPVDDGFGTIPSGGPGWSRTPADMALTAGAANEQFTERQRQTDLRRVQERERILAERAAEAAAAGGAGKPPEPPKVATGTPDEPDWWKKQDEFGRSGRSGQWWKPENEPETISQGPEKGLLFSLAPFGVQVAEMERLRNKGVIGDKTAQPGSWREVSAQLKDVEKQLKGISMEDAKVNELVAKRVKLREQLKAIEKAFEGPAGRQEYSGMLKGLRSEFDTFVDKFSAVAKLSGAAFGIGTGLVMGLPGAGSRTVRGSMALAATELGNVFIPQQVAMSGFLQDLADRIASLTPAQRQMIQDWVTVGLVGSGSVYAISTGLRVLNPIIAATGSAIGAMGTGLSFAAAHPLIALTGATVGYMAATGQLKPVMEAMKPAFAVIKDMAVGALPAIGDLAKAFAALVVAVAPGINAVLQRTVPLLTGVLVPALKLAAATVEGLAKAFGGLNPAVGGAAALGALVLAPRVIGAVRAGAGAMLAPVAGMLLPSLVRAPAPPNNMDWISGFNAGQPATGGRFGRLGEFAQQHRMAFGIGGGLAAIHNIGEMTDQGMSFTNILGSAGGLALAGSTLPTPASGPLAALGLVAVAASYGLRLLGTSAANAAEQMEISTERLAEIASGRPLTHRETLLLPANLRAQMGAAHAQQMRQRFDFGSNPSAGAATSSSMTATSDQSNLERTPTRDERSSAEQAIYTARQHLINLRGMQDFFTQPNSSPATVQANIQQALSQLPGNLFPSDYGRNIRTAVAQQLANSGQFGPPEMLSNLVSQARGETIGPLSERQREGMTRGQLAFYERIRTLISHPEAGGFRWTALTPEHIQNIAESMSGGSQAELLRRQIAVTEGAVNQSQAVVNAPNPAGASVETLQRHLEDFRRRSATGQDLTDQFPTIALERVLPSLDINRNLPVAQQNQQIIEAYERAIAIVTRGQGTAPSQRRDTAGAAIGGVSAAWFEDPATRGRRVAVDIPFNNRQIDEAEIHNTLQMESVRTDLQQRQFEADMRGTNLLLDASENQTLRLERWLERIERRLTGLP